MVLNLYQLRQLKEKMETLREQLRHLINTPRVNAVQPPNPANAAGPSHSGQLDLASVGRKEREASPVPSDWLKL